MIPKLQDSKIDNSTKLSCETDLPNEIHEFLVNYKYTVPTY